MCVRDGTEKCERPEKNTPCGWCILAKCPHALKNTQKQAVDHEFQYKPPERFPRPVKGCASAERMPRSRSTW